MNPPPLHTRRSFLRSTALGGALTSTVPSFFAATFDRLHAEAEGSAIAPTTGRDAPILVVLQLAGGNDGLNTVVPYADDAYHRVRPKLALKPGAVLKLNEQFGLHPALKGLRSLHDDGRLAIVHGIGYPNPNRSHFRSTDIWMTAADSDRVESLGWIGRYFDHACNGADPVVGLAVGRQNPLAFAARKPAGVAVDNTESYRYVDHDLPEEGESDSAGGEGFYRRMNGEDGPAMSGSAENTGGTIGAVGGSSPSGSPLDYLERTALDAQVSSDQIRRLSARTRNEARYPETRLARDFQLVARLIAGGLSTRVYFVSQGGYDTHTNQAATHQRLLTEMGEAVHAFQSDLKALGQQQRVLLMTFSEFGRRVSENGSAGTDHGAAAPLFLIGDQVRPGFHGTAPSLASADLQNGDLRFQTDFRCVYAAILDRWMRTSSASILGRQFEPTQLFVA
jgi:uncharacterized protein (DUF1501 family)